MNWKDACINIFEYPARDIGRSRTHRGVTFGVSEEYEPAASNLVSEQAVGDDHEVDALEVVDDLVEQRSLVPPGYEPVSHLTKSGRQYFTFKAPDGCTLCSRAEVWRHAGGAASGPLGQSPTSQPRSRPRAAPRTALHRDASDHRTFI